MRLAALAIVAMMILRPSLSFSAGDPAHGQSLYKTCVQCHGEKGQGMESQQAPKIGGQYDWYIVTQVSAFKKGERKNPVMLPFIKDLSDKDVQDIAAYVSTLKPN